MKINMTPFHSLIMFLRASWIWTLAIALFLSVSMNPQPAFAGRYVLNQTPETIEQSFGKYWTKLTRTDEKGQKWSTYTYSPAALRRTFPEYPFATLSMVYTNNKVQSVTMRPYRTAEEKQMDEIETTGSDPAIYQKVEAKLFEAIFGYRPSINKPLYLNYGVYYAYIDCLGDGVASTYAIHHGQRLASGVTLSYNATCEPPYDRIQLKTEKGPSGG